jgi:hypothetical protein
MGAGFITEMCNTLRVVHLHGFYGGMASTWTVKSLLASYLPQRLFLYCTEIKSSPAESRSIDLLNDEFTDNGEFLFIDSFGKYARVLSGVYIVPFAAVRHKNNRFLTTPGGPYHPIFVRTARIPANTIRNIPTALIVLGIS